MKFIGFQFVFVAVFAMAFAQDRVRVVDQPDQSQIILQNPDSGFYRPSNADPAFSRPTVGQQKPDISPVFVDQPYSPYKKYDDPKLRGGK